MEGRWFVDVACFFSEKFPGSFQNYELPNAFPPVREALRTKRIVTFIDRDLTCHRAGNVRHAGRKSSENGT